MRVPKRSEGMKAKAGTAKSPTACLLGESEANRRFRQKTYEAFFARIIE